MYFYAMSSYTVIVLGIMIMRSYKIGMFSDHFTLGIILVSLFLHPTLGGDYGLIYQTYMKFLGILLSIYIIANRKSIVIPSLKSVAVGLLWSASTVIILSLLYVFFSPLRGSLPSNLLNYIIEMSVFQLSFVTVIEEICFRGLIFGFMVMNGYKENTALFIQAILFWGIHYMDIANPVLFFGIVPLFTLSATLITKKYKMLFMSIVMHTLLNVFARVFIAMF